MSPEFQKWHAYYSEHFSRVSDDALQGYWYLFGRESEIASSPREEAAFAAVNYEMAHRASLAA